VTLNYYKNPLHQIRYLLYLSRQKYNSHLHYYLLWNLLFIGILRLGYQAHLFIRHLLFLQLFRLRKLVDILHKVMKDVRGVQLCEAWHKLLAFLQKADWYLMQHIRNSGDWNLPQYITHKFSIELGCHKHLCLKLRKVLPMYRG
jgi:hypothetical protein